LFDVGPGAIAYVHKQLLEAGPGERLRFHFGAWGWAVIATEPEQGRESGK